MSIFDNTEIAFKLKSKNELKKAQLLFKTVGNATLTRLGGSFIRWGIYLPGVKSIVKNTIFQQFCGGETQNECLNTIEKLHEKGVSSILDYSVEGKEEETEYDRAFKEVMTNIVLGKDDPAIPFVVFKPTAFGNIDLYEKIGENSALSEKEKQQWQAVRNRYEMVCQKAYEEDVTIMVDAEESWMQDATDDLVEEMMLKFNQERCIVVQTIQMYRHDRLQYLKDLYQDAEKNNHYIGFKVVRGAYMEKERERAAEKSYPSPIQLDKAATDRDYNLAIEFILNNKHRISLFAGTHNENSCLRLIDLMNQRQISKQDDKIWFGQLLGMSDNISFILGNLGYNCAKYVPYGPVKEVLPYLVRRAQENTSVSGQSGRELMLINKELKRRKK